MNDEKVLKEEFERFLKENGYETGYYVETSLVARAFKEGFEKGKKHKEEK